MRLLFLGVPAGLVVGSLAMVPAGCGFGLSVILAARIPRIIILIITTAVILAVRITAAVTAVVVEDTIDFVMIRRPNTSLEPTGVGAVSSAARLASQFAGGSVLGR